MPVKTLTFLRGHGDKWRQDLLNVLLLTMWAFDGYRVALFKTLVPGKRSIAILTVVFICGHTHSLHHGYSRLHLLPLKPLKHHDQRRFLRV